MKITELESFHHNDICSAGGAFLRGLPAFVGLR
jgi:hypothetical protein